MRKLITQYAPHQHSAFYRSEDEQSAEVATLHDEAFKGLHVPTDADLSGWEWATSKDSDNCSPRLLSVNLMFLTMEKASAFIGEVLRLMEQRPSARFFNANEKRLSESPEYGVKKRQ